MYKCQCGETNSSNFYGHKKSICGSCHNNYTINKGKENRQKAIDKLGGKCLSCGYLKYKASLDIHHLDPNKKDPNFSSYRGWSWERIEKELYSCILLCKNCHAAVHSGELII